nr:uncharacterized protein LOC105328763 [Crassostrea gigas]
MSKGIEVRFEWNVHIIRHFFPFESRVQNLIDYLHESPLREGNKMLTRINADKFLNPDDRLQPLLSGNSNIIEIAVEKLEIGGNSNDNNDEQLELTIDGDIESKKSDEKADKLVKMALGKLGDTTEAVAVLNQFTRVFLAGRPLDVQREDETIEGDTSPIYVSRESCLRDSIEELCHQKNLRFPLEVTFLGELAQDLGGPRREFFEKALIEMKEELFYTTPNSEIRLVENIEFLATKMYFYSGLLIGLSVLEGGPCPEFLDQALNHSENSEYWDQFRRGLNRVGLLTLLEKNRH